MEYKTAPLSEIAFARSGDKGNSANIAVFAYTPGGFEFLRQYLTASHVQEYFQSLGVVETKRYELPHLMAFNFVLKGVLGGGGSRSLRTDSQGKALGQALLTMPVHMPSHL